MCEGEDEFPSSENTDTSSDMLTVNLAEHYVLCACQKKKKEAKAE